MKTPNVLGQTSEDIENGTSGTTTTEVHKCLKIVLLKYLSLRVSELPFKLSRVEMDPPASPRLLETKDIAEERKKEK